MLHIPPLNLYELLYKGLFADCNLDIIQIIELNTLVVSRNFKCSSIQSSLYNRIERSVSFTFDLKLKEFD